MSAEPHRMWALGREALSEVEAGTACAERQYSRWEWTTFLHSTGVAQEDLGVGDAAAYPALELGSTAAGLRQDTLLELSLPALA